MINHACMKARSPVTGGIIRQQKGDASSLLALSEGVRTDPPDRIIFGDIIRGRRVPVLTICMQPLRYRFFVGGDVSG